VGVFSKIKIEAKNIHCSNVGVYIDCLYFKTYFSEKTIPHPRNHSMSRASTEDIVSRAVRMLTSPRSNAKIVCSACGEVALRTTTAALHLGGSVGKWSRNPSAGAFLLQTTTNSDDDMHLLLAKKGVVVLHAQQVVCAGIEHDIKGNGFKTHLKSETRHLCNKCTTIPGTSIRLRIDAQLCTDTEIEYIDTTVRILVGDNVKLQMCCSTCFDGIHKGTLVMPPRRVSGQSRHGGEAATASSMGSIATPGEARDTNRHGQLLYFSRNTSTAREVGILVWVVDQRVAVVEVNDMSDIFSGKASCYDLVSTNKSCCVHQSSCPMPCALCAKNIMHMGSATTAEMIDGYVNPTP
jgi:hypothetical protein